MRYSRSGEPIGAPLETIFDGLAQGLRGGRGIAVKHIGRDLIVERVGRKPRRTGILAGDVWKFTHDLQPVWSHNTNVDLDIIKGASIPAVSGAYNLNHVPRDGFALENGSMYVARLVKSPLEMPNPFENEVAIIVIRPDGTTESVHRFIVGYDETVASMESDFTGNYLITHISVVLIDDDYIFVGGSCRPQFITVDSGLLIKIRRSDMSLMWQRHYPVFLDDPSLSLDILSQPQIANMLFLDSNLIGYVGYTANGGYYPLNTYIYTVDRSTGAMVGTLPAYDPVEQNFFLEVPMGNYSILRLDENSFLTSGQNTHTFGPAYSFVFKTDDTGASIWKFPDEEEEMESPIQGVNNGVYAIATDGSNIYAPMLNGPSTGDGRIYKLDANGQLLIKKSIFKNEDVVPSDQSRGLFHIEWTGTHLVAGGSGRLLDTGDIVQLVKMDDELNITTTWTAELAAKNGIQGSDFTFVSDMTIDDDFVYVCLDRPNWKRK